MPENGKNRAIRRLRAGVWQLRHRLRRADVRSQLILWPIAVAIGIATGYAVILFRGGISWLQSLFYGASDEVIHSVAAVLPWYLVLSVPILGGLVVGLILTIATRDARARGVDAVIEAAAVRGGKVERRVGAIFLAARRRRRFRQASMRRLPGRCSRWRWCSGIMLCTRSDRS
jgi:CIC family chloride channel protein